ncbi:hypothetical protein ACFO0N_07195 [Halobium salinum]|uniref:Uncharacterized protein n=1 Tax=Halobium salinum TaxID=1364940 RepID=A0ABD5PAH3_9EURY|nr:hypothetical protein [Halobium salinum]
MDHRTVGDDIAEAISELEAAIENDGYDELMARDQAYLHEALHYLTLVQRGPEPGADEAEA